MILATTAYKFKRYGECLFAISQLQARKVTQTNEDMVYLKAKSLCKLKRYSEAL